MTLLAALTSGACAVSLREASSGPTGCAPSDIVTYNESPAGLTQTWTAECGGQEYRCSGASRDTGFPFLYDVVGASCSPVRKYAATAAAVPAVREGRTRAGQRSLTGTFRVPEASFLLYGVPSVSPDLVALYIDLPTPTEGCEIALAIDGQAAPAPSHVRFETKNRLKVSLPAKVVASMGEAEAIAGRICDHEFRLDERARKTVRAFSIAFHEAVVLQPKPTAAAPGDPSDK
jgi:hypothetical protein